MERNCFKYNGFSIAPVTDFNVIAGANFSSGDEDIDDFFLNEAEESYKNGMSVTYEVRIDDLDIPLAYLSLHNDAVELKESDRLALGYKYKYTPAVKLGRLGVNKDYQSNGIGSAVLVLLKGFMRNANRTGCRLVSIDAYNKERIIAFYQRNGFNFVRPPKENRDTVPMFLDIYS